MVTETKVGPTDERNPDNFKTLNPNSAVTIAIMNNDSMQVADFKK
jgi:hypothetical protein